MASNKRLYKLFSKKSKNLQISYTYVASITAIFHKSQILSNRVSLNLLP